MTTVCPICRDVTIQEQWQRGDRQGFDCQACGYFEASRSVLTSTLTLDAKRLTPVQYAALSHRIRLVVDSCEEAPVLTTYMLNEMLPNLRLPSPGEQATNILKFFGDEISRSGEQARNPDKSFVARVGASNRSSALRIVKQLVQDGSLLVSNLSYLNTADEPDGIDLSLKGWAKWESERRGESAGNYGFMALKFYDVELDAFQKDVIKPALGELGYALEDMRDAARAGLIDNVMRARIRDAAFVLVDLSHGNEGAYWEAGYAEGVGKPVLYLCKDAVFDTVGTHFDTSHCTTIKWNSDYPAKFREELIATLRRSLGLFDTAKTPL